MILPGISGSFLLVLLAKYEFILNAVKELRLDVIAVFGVGCVVGILSFSRVLKWALKNYPDATVALLTGFMVGSLNKVWPWKQTIETYTDRHGEVKPLVQQTVSPENYESLTGQESFLVYFSLWHSAGGGRVFTGLSGRSLHGERWRGQNDFHQAGIH